MKCCNFKKMLLVVVLVVSMVMPSISALACECDGEYMELYSRDVLCEMSDSEKRDLDVFLSNFAETNLIKYDAKSYCDNNELISFAFLHNLINNNSRVFYDGEKAKISAAYVNTTIDKYFGKSVPHQTAHSLNSYIDSWTYNNGYFTQPTGSGESYAYFSDAYIMADNGDGTYTVLFQKYFDKENAFDMVTPDRYWMSEPWITCDYVTSGKAVVSKKMYNGKMTYQLEYYEIY